MMWWWHSDHMGVGGWIGMGLMILFWIAVIVAIILLIRHLATRPSTGSWQETAGYRQEQGSQAPRQAKSEAMRILEERYARGDIEQEEFHKRKKDLLS